MPRFTVSLLTTVGVHTSEAQVLIEAGSTEQAIELADRIAASKVSTAWRSIIPVNGTDSVAPSFTLVQQPTS